MTKKDKQEILFGNMTFINGTNITCRLGTKWAEALTPGEQVTLSPASKLVPKTSQDAIVIGTYVCEFGMIPHSFLWFEHDPKCRSLTGLYREMKSVYGNDFHSGEVVTLIVFETEGDQDGEKRKKIGFTNSDSDSD